MASSTIRRDVLGQLAGLIGLGGLPLAAHAEEDGDLPVFRRGIGIGHAMNWADVEEDGSYVYPPFSGERFRFDATQRRTIRRAGFDFVRLAIDVGPFLAFEGERAGRIDNHLIETVRALLEDGLGVIVDLHPSDMSPAYKPAVLTTGTEAPKFQAVLAFLTRIAGKLEALTRKGPSPRLALELMNEPEVPPGRWQPMLEAAYRAARRGSARLPLVIGGGSQNSAEALEAIDTRAFAADRRLIYTFHDYQPWQFTHQGVEGNPAFPFDAVAYPAPSDPAMMQAATEFRISGLSGAELDALGGRANALAKARSALRSYARSGFDRTALEQPYLRLTAWRKARGLPPHAILLGEFGAHLTPFGRTDEGAASRERWLRDTREVAEAQGFAWACWQYRGNGGFALSRDETGPGFDPATTRALGLAPT